MPEAALELLRERFLRLFDGEYETGIKPDEVNWVPGRDPEDRTRQICNGWRADNVVAAQVLSERTGRLAAQLARYAASASSRTTCSGSRRAQRRSASTRTRRTRTTSCRRDDHVLDLARRPAGRRGPVEYVRGSHLWPTDAAGALAVPRAGGLARAGAGGGAGRRGARLVPVVVKAGGGSFHHGRTWHGSPPNTSAERARMALVSHMLPVEARFHETNVDLIYSRYRRRGDLSLDESFFPVLWDESGYRTPWLAELRSDGPSPGSARAAARHR